jgi:hypothetical protein
MLFPPELQEEFGVKAGERVPAMDGDMAAPAQGNVQRRAILAGVPMVHQQVRVRQTQLATAIAGEDSFPLPGKKPDGVPAPVVAGAAQPLGHQRLAAAGTTPPGRLRPAARSQSSVLRCSVLIRPCKGMRRSRSLRLICASSEASM